MDALRFRFRFRRGGSFLRGGTGAAQQLQRAELRARGGLEGEAKEERRRKGASAQGAHTKSHARSQSRSSRLALCKRQVPPGAKEEERAPQLQDHDSCALEPRGLLPRHPCQLLCTPAQGAPALPSLPAIITAPLRSAITGAKLCTLC